MKVVHGVDVILNVLQSLFKEPLLLFDGFNLKSIIEDSASFSTHALIIIVEVIWACLAC